MLSFWVIGYHCKILNKGKLKLSSSLRLKSEYDYIHCIYIAVEMKA